MVHYEIVYTRPKLWRYMWDLFMILKTINVGFFLFHKLISFLIFYKAVINFP